MAKSVKEIFSADFKQSFLNNLARLFTGPISLLLIPLFTTVIEQGYWYSFIGLLSITVLVDLGFNIIITQFAAHEFANLKIVNNYTFDGEKSNFDRFASLFRFLIKWGFFTTIIAFPIILIMGYFLFSGQESMSFWGGPWILFVVGSGLAFYIEIVCSFYIGCNLIALIQKIRNNNLILYFIVNVFCLTMGKGLYSIGISRLFSSVFFMAQMWYTFNLSFKQLLFKEIVLYNWRKEIIPLFKKYSLSFMGGYLIFNLFTPFAFKYFGSSFAGQIGITITLVFTIFSFANLWITIITPKINMLVAKKEWKELDIIFRANLWKAIITFVLLSILSLISLSILMAFFPKFNGRFLNFESIIILEIVWLIQLIINSLSVYSRSFKEEVFVIPSLVTGLFVSFSTFLICNFLPEKYFFYGFFSSFIFSAPWFYKIYLRRKHWHQSF